jgi:SAM-dependent methyltransferase
MADVRGGALRRLRAWWEGAAGAPDAPASRPPTPRAEARAWPAERIAVAELIWGRGFHRPGGDAAADDIAADLGLSREASIVEIGAGLGGLGRAIAQRTGARVIGLEADPGLAAAGMERSVAAGLSARAPVRAFSPEAPAVGERLDGAIALGSLNGLARKDPLLDALAKALRPRARLLVVDYALTASAAASPALEALRALDPGAAHLATQAAMEAMIAARRLEPVAVEDVTEGHRRLVVAAWGRVAVQLSARGTEGLASPSLLLAEAELWRARIAAIDAGALGVVRLLAEAPIDTD